MINAVLDSLKGFQSILNVYSTLLDLWQSFDVFFR
jgi:hypothetical protein